MKHKTRYSRFCAGHRKDIFIEVLLKVLNVANNGGTCAIGYYFFDEILLKLSAVSGKVVRQEQIHRKFTLVTKSGCQDL